jgi:hypothetical protein
MRVGTLCYRQDEFVPYAEVIGFEAAKKTQNLILTGNKEHVTGTRRVGSLFQEQTAH